MSAVTGDQPCSEEEDQLTRSIDKAKVMVSSPVLENNVHMEDQSNVELAEIALASKVVCIRNTTEGDAKKAFSYMDLLIGVNGRDKDYNYEKEDFSWSVEDFSGDVEEAMFDKKNEDQELCLLKYEREPK